MVGIGAYLQKKKEADFHDRGRTISKTKKKRKNENNNKTFHAILIPCNLDKSTKGLSQKTTTEKRGHKMQLHKRKTRKTNLFS